jgi:hypothetical protein
MRLGDSEENSFTIFARVAFHQELQNNGAISTAASHYVIISLDIWVS